MLNRIAVKLKQLHFSLRSKLGVAFFVVLIGFIINGIISIVLLLSINQAWADQTQSANSLERTQIFANAYKAKLDLFVGLMFVTKNRQFVENRDFENLLGREATRTTTDAAQRTFEENLSREYLKVFEPLTQISDFIRQGRFDEAQLVWRRSEPTLNNLTSFIDKRTTTLRQEITNTGVNLRNIIFSAIALSIGVTVLAIFLTLLVLAFVRLIIVQPINQIQTALDQMARGDLQQAQTFSIENRDELGKLAESFRTALGAVQNIIKGVQITNNLDSLSMQLATVSQQQQAGTSTQLSAFNQVISAIQELSRTAGSIANSSAGMASQTDETQEHISRMISATEQNNQKLKQMIDVTQSTLQGISTIEGQINGLHQNILELNEHATSINRVLDLLTAISNEVKILALNAGIEAASAGEYGDRFREVARQVRELAMRSNMAAVEARQLIEVVQLSSRTTVGQAEEGLTTVEQLSRQNTLVQDSLLDLEMSAQTTNLVISELLVFAEEVTQQTQEIKVATHQQLLASEQVMLSAQSAQDVTRQNVDTSGYLAKGSQELRKLTSQLGDVLGQIRLAG